jgi:ribosome-binding protein aMBF1 (putative translation factor)
LGWSRADLSRRLAVGNGVVASWETGAAVPDGESLSQLDYLEGQIVVHRERTALQTSVELFLEANNLDQVNIEDVVNNKPL